MNTININYSPKGITLESSGEGYSSTVISYGDNIEVHKAVHWNRNPSSIEDGKTQTTILNLKDKYNNCYFTLGDVAPSLLVGKSIGIYKVDNDDFRFSKAIIGSTEKTIQIQKETLSDYNNGLKKIKVDVILHLVTIIKVS